ncbi:unnamed protein product, partial [Meganyctiphanes norvegica]
ESTDARDTAQLAIFICGINSNFDVIEEFLQLMPLKDTTTGEDIFEAVIKCFEIYKLDLSKLVSVTTDGAAAMVGIRKGFVSLLEKHLHSAGYDNNLFKIHCIIHQEALCAKNVDVKAIMEVVVKIINFIRSNGLNHRQFQELL